MKVSMELPVITRHRRDMTEKMLKVTLNPNKQQQQPSCKWSVKVKLAFLECMTQNVLRTLAILLSCSAMLSCYLAILLSCCPAILLSCYAILLSCYAILLSCYAILLSC